MRPCPVCGTLVGESDEFCGNCGSYLGWSQQQQQPTAEESTVDEPAPVQPARPVAPRPVRSTQVTEAPVDGVPCPNCGTTNPPDRRYCRKCATPLTEAAQAAPPRRRGWWSRRRDGSGRLARALVLLAVVLALAVAGFLLQPLGVRLFQDVLDKTSQAVPVHPSGERASAESPGHPAAAAVDGATNRYWGAPGKDAWIEFTFDHPFRLLSLIINTGASTTPNEFAAQARPTQFDVLVTGSDGTVTTVPAPLADRPGPQTVQTGISDVVRIRLVVRAVAGFAPGKEVALGEVEFFQRS
ncbi:hypothetical protein F0L68_24260 [Solihabitans fulvus]|uniref:DUF7577 domain-containing protein n=1 Tax=Solihabitans fulvus TaxID=1892852 RepID=A0A5B2X4U3_9PSEU|nr:zinc-ribbon domain-containing protein [Solihabitans fulvus]KAA2258092.1 hypothetical protein F0L68_24260 [Solihabitans fulvus]